LQLKDEVVLLKAALRTKEGKLAASEEVAEGLKADLLESKQQVCPVIQMEVHVCVQQF
jgi:hypothetical protein